ncbi:hypothetical protein JM18_000759 [Phytophthora kernoviae]|uniref:ATPase dynein-related AAA domain-containing protein n=1 Tax=Phytophthora kernoviae TaxID=325452 RepID=A0A8T0M912_9STRA|nr:hypothetical protein JM16_000677 [Phytophthora kernoviae]KAG2532740.1 hypothetical protein JM18_000759 [Phytophthora kernoviae]
MLRTLGRQSRGWRISAERHNVFSMRRVATRGGSSTQQPSVVEIGGVKAHVATAKSIELVPRGYMTELQQGRPMPQELLGHLRWMLQKDLLKQDMFLIGPPGSSRRLLSMRFCELLNKEVEYIAISQDTTESDLKQRREIVDGAAIFTDQAPVRAAINGRVLVIDGLEKAERNVLPTLNNLLENREMMLDDGRFLMKAESYDALVDQGYTADVLEAQNLVRVHPDFRVIALGLPVPPYPGRTLDPPLRSRFQARNIRPSTPGTQLEELVAIAPTVPMPTLEKLVGIREAANAIEAMYDIGTSTGPPGPIPGFIETETHSEVLVEMIQDHAVGSDLCVLGAKGSGKSALVRLFASRMGQLVDSLLDECQAPTTALTTESLELQHQDIIREEGGHLHIGNVSYPIQTPGNLELVPQPHYFDIPKHTRCMKDMLQDVVAGQKHMLLIGNQGVGKNKLADRLLQLLQQEREYIQLHRDVSS